jgi:hypothetical protein
MSLADGSIYLGIIGDATSRLDQELFTTSDVVFNSVSIDTLGSIPNLQATNITASNIYIDTLGSIPSLQVTNVTASNDVLSLGDVTGKSLFFSGSGSYNTGCIYSDGNWGCLFRSRGAGAVSSFSFADAANDYKSLHILNTGQIQINPDGSYLNNGVEVNGTMVLDGNDDEALLVRKDADGGDVLTIDTNLRRLYLTGDGTNNPVVEFRGVTNTGYLYLTTGGTDMEWLGPTGSNLYIKSSAGSVIIPNVSSTGSVTTTVAGGLIFDTTVNKMKFYNGSAWETISSA